MARGYCKQGADAKGEARARRAGIQVGRALVPAPPACASDQAEPSRRQAGQGTCPSGAPKARRRRQRRDAASRKVPVAERGGGSSGWLDGGNGGIECRNDRLGGTFLDRIPVGRQDRVAVGEADTSVKYRSRWPGAEACAKHAARHSVGRAIVPPGLNRSHPNLFPNAPVVQAGSLYPAGDPPGTKNPERILWLSAVLSGIAPRRGKKQKGWNRSVSLASPGRDDRE